MNTLYEFEDIEDYIKGRMSASDRRAFELALESDPELASRLEALRSEATVNRLLREEYLLEQFAQWEQEEKDASTVAGNTGMTGKMTAYRRWIIPAGIAASVISLICAGIAFHWFDGVLRQPAITGAQPHGKPDTFHTPAPETHNPGLAVDSSGGQSPKKPSLPDPNTAFYATLADSAYIDEDFNQALMGAENSTNQTSRYARAVKLYIAGQYRDALKLLEKPEQNQLEEFLYLRGYTYYHLGQYTKAETDFHAFRNFPVSDRKMDAQWCEVFCMLRQLPASRKRLELLLLELKSNPGNVYAQRAAALWKTLQR